VKFIIAVCAVVYETSGQKILTKGCIAMLSPLAAANGFVWPWPHLIVHWAHPSKPSKRHLDRFRCFSRAHFRVTIRQTNTDYVTPSVPTARILCNACDAAWPNNQSRSVVFLKWTNHHHDHRVHALLYDESDVTVIYAHDSQYDLRVVRHDVVLREDHVIWIKLNRSA